MSENKWNCGLVKLWVEIMQKRWEFFFMKINVDRKTETGSKSENNRINSYKRIGKVSERNVKDWALCRCRTMKFGNLGI